MSVLVINGASATEQAMVDKVVKLYLTELAKRVDETMKETGASSVNATAACVAVDLLRSVL